MKAKSSKFFKIIAFLLCFLLCIEQSGFAQIAGQLDISGHLANLRNAFSPDVFRPLHLRYLSYNPLENNFQLFLDRGSLKNPNRQELEDTTKTLLNYFFIGIALPNDTFWVNLRPDAEDNIIDEQLAQTDVGKIMLETDLQLKKDTAKFTSPEIPEGREYWDKLYKKAGEIFGSENITIPTLTRPWIVPDEIIIRETQDSAYIYKATLKVMLEQDYLKDSTVYSFKDERLKELNEYSSQLIREIIIPKLTKEVNSSKRYASLRQVYYSLIMAQWFKTRFQGEQGKYYGLINSQNLQNLSSKEPWLKTFYFKEYQKSFQQGEYNIQEPIYTPYGQTIRSYFSGGISGIAPSIPNLGTTLTDPKTGTASSSIVSPTPPSLNRNVVIGIKVGATDNLAELGKVEIITTASPETAHGDVNTDRIYMEHLEIKPPSVGIIMKQNRERLISHYVKEVSRAYKAREENISDREIIEELQKEIGRLRDKGMEITINIRLEALKRIASERGYRSVEENGMFARKVYEDREDYIRKRRRLQEALRSFLTLKTDPEIAPVYGAVSESGQHVGSAYGYGFITLVIKPNNERTVFFAGDSLIHFDGGENESWKDRIMDFEGALAAMAMKNLIDEKNAEYIVGYASPGLAMLKDGISWNDPRIVDTFGIGYVEAILFNAVNSTNIQEIRIYLDPIDAFDTIRQVSILIQSFPWLFRKIKMRYHGQLGFIKGLWSWYRTRYNPRDLLTIIGEADDREEQLQEDGWVDDPKAIRTIEEMRDKLVKYSGLSNPNLTDPKLIKMKKQIEALSELTKARHFIDQNMPDLAINELDIVSSTAQAKAARASSPAEASSPVTESTRPASSPVMSTRTTERIRGYVIDLEYSDETARKFTTLITQWQDKDGNSLIDLWRERIEQARKHFAEKIISLEGLTSIEAEIINELAKKIMEEVESGNEFDLNEIAEFRCANCTGYTELAYILANTLGLTAIPTLVFEFENRKLYPGEEHIMVLMKLSDGKVIQLDPLAPHLISEPFALEQAYSDKGYYLEIPSHDNPLKIHRKIKPLLNKDSLIADIYNHRGAQESNPDTAIVYYKKALALDSSFMAAHANLAIAYKMLGRYSEALASMDRAISLLPDKDSLYYNRGNIHSGTGNIIQAIEDHTHAIGLNPELVEAYYNRAGLYIKLSDLTGDPAEKTNLLRRADADLTEGITVITRKGWPERAELYFNRGVVRAALNRRDEATSDLIHSLELNPDIRAQVERVVNIYRLSLPPHQGASSPVELTGQQLSVVTPLIFSESSSSPVSILEPRLGILAFTIELSRTVEEIRSSATPYMNVIEIWVAAETGVDASNFIDTMIDTLTRKYSDWIVHRADDFEASFKIGNRMVIHEYLEKVRPLEITSSYFNQSTFYGKKIILINLMASDAYIREHSIYGTNIKFVPAPSGGDLSSLWAAATKASSPATANTGDSPLRGQYPLAPGGIDFRSLPIVTQAVTNLSANIASSAIHNLISINLDEEWQQIERMANSGITPSSERIKEYIQTSCAQDNITQDRDKILLCISDILRLEEERCDPTDATLKDILVVLESMGSTQELRQVFLGTIS